MEKELVNALRRLERVGSETSKCTQKLKDSCDKIAGEILSSLSKSGVCTPEEICGEHKVYTIGKVVYEPHTDDTYDRLYLNINDTYYGFYAHSVYRVWDTDIIRRDDALAFAKLVNDGLIDEVAAYIKERQ